MRTLALTTLLASGALLLAGPPAVAASTMSDAFVAYVRPNVDFLDDASRLAIDASPSARIRAFAHDEAMEQTLTANQLVAWGETNIVRGEAVTLGTPVVGEPLTPVGALVAAPLTVAGGVDNVVTGRSVAVAEPTGALVGGDLPPSGQRDLERLRSMKGRQFDALYRATQNDSLRRLAILYTDYIANGDDPGLRALAQRELPRVDHRLAQLRRL